MMTWVIVLGVIAVFWLGASREAGRRPEPDASAGQEGLHTFIAHTYRVKARWMAVAFVALVGLSFPLHSRGVAVGGLGALLLSYGFGRTRDDHERQAMVASGVRVTDEGMGLGGDADGGAWS